MNRPRLWTLLSCLAAAAACGRALDGGGVGPHGITVQASLSAVTLADDCAGTKSPPSGGSCSTGLTCGGCQQSNVQIALTAGPGSASLPIAVVAVRVIRPSDGKVLDTLDARDPSSWNGSSYVAWDETLSAGTSVQTSYDISAPHWSSLSADSRSTASDATYRLEVDLSIDGVLHTIALDGVTREPILST